MAAINFPLNPTPGQQFVAANVSWTWDGAKWTALGNTLGVADAPADGQLYGRKNNSWSPASGGGAGVPEAPVDGTSYARKNATWAHLTHNDITDWATFVPAPYVLPTATTSVLGGVKIDGTSITIAGGVISGYPGTTISDTAPSSPANGALWFDSVSGQLFVRYNDGNSSQWVPTTNQMGGGYYLATNPSDYQSGAQVAASLAPYATTASVTAALVPYATTASVNSGLAGKLNLTGGALTGQLTINTTTVPGFYLQCGAGNPTMTISTGVIASQWYYDVSQGSLYLSYGSTWLRLQTDGSFAIASALAYKPSGTTWTVGSDERIKTVLGDYDKGLDEVLQLRPVEFVYNGNETFDADVNARVQTDPDYNLGDKAAAAPYPASPHYQLALDQTLSVGFVAQEMEDIFPGMVSRREGYIDGEPISDLRDMDTHELIFALVNAVKTLAARVQALETGR